MDLLQRNGYPDPGEHRMHHDRSDAERSARDSTDPEQQLQDSGTHGDETRDAPTETGDHVGHHDGQPRGRAGDLQPAAAE